MSPAHPGTEDTLDLARPAVTGALLAAPGPRPPAPTTGSPPAAGQGPAKALVGAVEGWPPVGTPFGTFRLVPADPGRDPALVGGWMNDPAVAAFWELAGEPAVTARHIAAQTGGDGRSVPCLGLLDGTPMSYWEVYRADLDPLARAYAARPQDTGIHLLIGAPADRGRGLGAALIAAVADMVLDNRPDCARVVAEPDLRNIPSVAAFLTAGFRLSAEIGLPGKRAALMIRERALRRLL